MLASSSIALSSLIAGCVFETESPDTGNDTAETGQDNETDQDDNKANIKNGESSADTDEDNETEETRDILITLRNITSTVHQGSLTLSTDTKTILQQSFEIEGGGQESIDSEIIEPGQYDLSVSTEAGTETSFPFSIEEYDLRAGSDLIVEIDEDNIMILMQE